MESMLYVVLYCALFYLEVTGGNSADCIQYMFDAVIFNRDGDTWGGNGKAANALDRSYTSDLTWSCPDVKVWLDRVMELHRPVTTPLLQRMKPANQWTAASLNAFWSQFLTQRTGLPLSDRKHSHLLSAEEKADKFMSRFMRGVPNPAPVGYGVQGVVHKRASSPLDHEAPPRRKQRTCNVEPALESEPGVVPPSTEPPPSSVADSDDSDNEGAHVSICMPPGEAAAYQLSLFPSSVASLSTNVPSLGPPFPTSWSIEAHSATMYGHTSSPSLETDSADASSTSGQASAARKALESPTQLSSQYLNCADSPYDHLRRDAAAPGPMLHDGPRAQPSGPHWTVSERRDHMWSAPQGHAARHYHIDPSTSRTLLDRTGMSTLAVAGPSRDTAGGVWVPRPVATPDPGADAHMSRSGALCDVTTPPTRGPARASLAASARTSGKRPTRRHPGGH